MYRIGSTIYGQSKMRLLGVLPGDRFDRARDVQVSMTLEGDFQAMFERGENREILPTRTMANTSEALLHDHLASSIEQYGQALAEQLLQACPAAHTAKVWVREVAWTVLRSEQASGHGFDTGSVPAAICDAVARRDRPTSVVSGLDGVHVALTTGSSFVGFLRDEYTTMSEIGDRVLHQSGVVQWEFAARPDDYDRHRATAHQAIMTVMANHTSPSIQHTLYVLGSAVLDACPLTSRVKLRFRTHGNNLVDMSPFGRRDGGRVYVTTVTPHGIVEGTVERSDAALAD